MKEESCDNITELDDRIKDELEYFQKYFISKGKAESDAGIKKSEELKRLRDLRFRFAALSPSTSTSTSVVSDLKVASDEKEREELLRLMGEFDCKNIEEIDERLQDELDYYQKYFISKGKADSESGVNKKKEISRLEDIRTSYAQLFLTKSLSTAEEEEKKEKAEVLRLLTEVDCTNIDELDERIRYEKVYFQKKYISKGKADSEDAVKHGVEISNMEEIRSRYMKVFSTPAPKVVPTPAPKYEMIIK